MFQMSIEPRARISPSFPHPMALTEMRLPSPADLALWREKVRSATARTAMRFAAEACKSSSRDAFRPGFTTADWHLFASFCVTTRLPAGFRVVMPGSADRTLRFLVEGSLSQACASVARDAGRQPALLLPGAIQGEDAAFSTGLNELDVRALEDSLILELSPARRKELMAACPAIACELLRAAGEVMAARRVLATN